MLHNALHVCLSCMIIMLIFDVTCDVVTEMNTYNYMIYII